MISSYLKTALRNFRRHKTSFFINVAGLSIGMACSILILLWVNDELAYDRFHQDIDRIYRVMENQHYAGGDIFTTSSTPGPLAPALKEEVPEIEYAATYTWNVELLFRKNEISLKESGIYTRNDLFRILTVRLETGSRDDLLVNPRSVVLSRSLADKYFEGKNPVGESIDIGGQVHTVTGVFKDLPENSSLQFDYALPFDDFQEENPWTTSWGNNGPRTVLKVNEGAGREALNAKIADFIRQRNEGSVVELFLYPYADSYLYGRFNDGRPAGGRIEYVRLFTVIALLVLLIACINFMNLSTARSTKRAKEVGIRKSIGAGRGSLVGQFLGESVFIAFAALAVSVFLVELFLPVFNDLAQKQIAVDYLDPDLMMMYLGIALVTGLVAGSYPAFYLSAYQTVEVLKGTIKSSRGELFARKGLVIIQFGLSVILIVSTFVIYRQIEFVHTKNLGYDRENLLYFHIEGALVDQWETFGQQLEQIPEVTRYSRSNHTFLGRNSSTGDVEWPGRATDETVLFESVRADYGLIETLGFGMTEGRSFSREFGTDTAGVLFNETGIKVMEMEDPIGKTVNFWGQDWEIIGVLDDFNYQNLRYEVQPLFVIMDPDNARAGFIRLNTSDITRTLGQIEEVYKQFNPEFPFDYTFMDQRYEQLYRSEMRVRELAKYFGIFAILISCLGLLGLSAFTAEQRTKEIGIRKVLGATMENLVLLLTREFTLLVLVSILLAIPVSWWLMELWLNDFAYHAEIAWWIFPAAGGIALVIAWVTVSWQSVKAALSDPVQSLRAE